MLAFCDDRTGRPAIVDLSHFATRCHVKHEKDRIAIGLSDSVDTLHLVIPNDVATRLVGALWPLLGDRVAWLERDTNNLITNNQTGT